MKKVRLEFDWQTAVCFFHKLPYRMATYFSQNVSQVRHKLLGILTRQLFVKRTRKLHDLHNKKPRYSRCPNALLTSRWHFTENYLLIKRSYSDSDAHACKKNYKFRKKKQQRPVRMQLKLSYSYQDTGHVFTRQGDFQVHLKWSDTWLSQSSETFHVFQMSAPLVFFTVLNPLLTGRTWCFLMVCNAPAVLPVNRKQYRCVLSTVLRNLDLCHATLMDGPEKNKIERFHERSVTKLLSQSTTKTSAQKPRSSLNIR